MTDWRKHEIPADRRWRDRSRAAANRSPGAISQRPELCRHIADNRARRYFGQRAHRPVERVNMRDYVCRKYRRTVVAVRVSGLEAAGICYTAHGSDGW